LATVRLSRTLEVMLLQGVTRQKKPQRGRQWDKLSGLY